MRINFYWKSIKTGYINQKGREKNKQESKIQKEKQRKE